METICWDMAVEVPQLYRWKKRLEEQKDRYLGVLESARHSTRETMAWLMGLADYVVEFAEKYLSRVLHDEIPMRKPHSMKWQTVLTVYTMDSS